MTAQEAFKVGFLERCVEARVPAEQVPGLAKQAAALLAKQADLTGLLGKGIDLAKSVGGAGLHYGGLTAALAPPLLGLARGAGLAKLTDIDDTDVEDIKNQETVAEYRRQTDQLRRQLAARAFAHARPHHGRPLR